MTTVSLTGIIDYGVGNVRSVQSAVEAVGGTAILSSDHNELLACDRLILPGVGAFAYGMNALELRGLDKIVKQAVAEDMPLLGICLGMQMLTRSSQEFGESIGLELTEGIASQLTPTDSSQKLRLPHVAWKPIRRKTDDMEWLYEGIDPDARFYFIHSFAIGSDSGDVAATADHDGVEFAAILSKGSVIGTQFHPEKSGPEGLKMLKNFVFKG